MNRFVFLLFSILLSLSAPVPASADDGLYGAPFPSDAVFLRHFGNPGDTRLFGRTFKADELPGETFVAISASELDGAVPGTHYSFYGQSPGLRLVAEPAREKNGKVHLILVNLSDTAARLVILENGAEVVAWVEPGHAASRAVNPVSVDLAVETPNGATTVPVKLRRGQNVSILATNSEVRVVPDAFGPVLD